MGDEIKVICRTPTKGREGVTRIPKWKYDCVRAAILDVVEAAPGGQVYFKDLTALLKPRLTDDQLESLGSAGWHVTTVKLNMEVEGELIRVPNVKPQAIRKSWSTNPKFKKCQVRQFPTRYDIRFLLDFK